jgi:putative cell wall-binding protein
MNITLGFVIGDTKSVDAATYNSIRSLIIANGSIGTIAERWSGPNRYETARAVIEKGLTNRWIDLDTLGVAVGTKFPDALGGGAALGYYGSPIILTDGTSLSGATSTFLAEHEYEIGRVDVYGDSNSVSTAVYDAISTRIK